MNFELSEVIAALDIYNESMEALSCRGSILYVET